MASKSSKIIVGLDEAGRGPVLGPLVMVALAVKEEDQKKLEWLGVKDSKQLSSETREELFERIHEISHDFRVEVIEPDAIDLSLKDPGTNLNWLEGETSARLVSELNPDTIILDCPSPNISAYRDFVSVRLNEAVRKKAKLIVEHKADVNHIVVAAASIIAKVIRDRAIDHIRSELRVDCGSGYMSDPKTQEFLEKYHDVHPHFFRKGWQSFKDVEERKKQKSLVEF